MSEVYLVVNTEGWDDTVDEYDTLAEALEGVQDDFADVDKLRLYRATELPLECKVQVIEGEA